ncbi:hypothetical protein FQN53_007899 [Emmonsiellopsis sp. PD_33]|nr:hypothetical protein FQN53_007899 [Emmonsiellopsis sp. PD_33]
MAVNHCEAKLGDHFSEIAEANLRLDVDLRAFILALNHIGLEENVVIVVEVVYQITTSLGSKNAVWPNDITASCEPAYLIGLVIGAKDTPDLGYVAVVSHPGAVALTIGRGLALSWQKAGVVAYFRFLNANA